MHITFISSVCHLIAFLNFHLKVALGLLALSLNKYSLLDSKQNLLETNLKVVRLPLLPKMLSFNKED